jgi:hypothetical protein
MSPSVIPSPRQNCRLEWLKPSTSPLRNALSVQYAMNCQNSAPKALLRSSHTLAAIIYCQTAIASAWSSSNCLIRSMRLLPQTSSIHIVGDRLMSEERLNQLDKLYRSVTTALNQLVAAVGLKIAA